MRAAASGEWWSSGGTSNFSRSAKSRMAATKSRCSSLRPRSAVGVGGAMATGRGYPSVPPRNPAATLYPGVDAWTDERLDDLAASLRALPAHVARLTDVVERNSEDIRDLTAAVFGLQRQLAHIG